MVTKIQPMFSFVKDDGARKLVEYAFTITLSASLLFALIAVIFSLESGGSPGIGTLFLFILSLIMTGSASSIIMKIVSSKHTGTVQGAALGATTVSTLFVLELLLAGPNLEILAVYAHEMLAFVAIMALIVGSLGAIGGLLGSKISES